VVPSHQPDPSHLTLAPERTGDIRQWAAPAPAPAPVRAGAAVRFDTGQVIDIVGVVLLGRDPAVNPGEVATCVPVQDSEMSLSKTHLAVAPGDDGVVLTDRFSTNGAFIVGDDSVERVIAPGIPVNVGFGTTLRLGRRYARVDRT
jgi:hypothetical protein